MLWTLLAVVDTRSTSGLLAIDRMGTRTMCYANSSDQLVFASNAESVVAHPAVGRDLSRQAIFNYLFCHVIPSPGTIYRSVRKLLPGECVTFRGGVLETRTVQACKKNALHMQHAPAGSAGPSR